MTNSSKQLNRTVFFAFGLVLLISPGIATAQSRIISIDEFGKSSSGSRTIQGPSLATASATATEITTPSSLAANQRKWEQILNGRYETPFDDQEQYVFRDVLKWVQALNLPITLHWSAEDDSLTGDDFFRLQMPGEPLLTRLEYSLNFKNSTLAMYPNHMAIVSMDVADDPEYFISEFYPIGNITSGNYDDLIQDIKYSINPGYWEDENGDAYISHLVVNGVPTISLYAPYSTHRLLRAYLSNLQRINGLKTGRQLVTSQIIQLPLAGEKKKPKKKKKGHGIGGFGGGGGIF